MRKLAALSPKVETFYTAGRYDGVPIFRCQVITKRRAPTSPKPRVARPVPRRNLKTQNKAPWAKDS